MLILSEFGFSFLNSGNIDNQSCNGSTVSIEGELRWFLIILMHIHGSQKIGDSPFSLSMLL